MYKNYFKIAMRNIMKFKSFSIINILGMALGTAACIIILLYVQDQLSFDNYHNDVDRIFRAVVNVQSRSGDIEYATTPSSFARALNEDFPQVENAVRFMINPELTVQFTSDKKFKENRIFLVDPEVFDVFNIQFISGDKTCFAHPQTTVITEEIAKKYFGDIDPIGKLLDFGHAKFEVKGVIKNVQNNSHLKFDILISLTPFNRQNWKVDGWNNYDGQSNLNYTYIKFRPNTEIKLFEDQLKNISSNYAGVLKLHKSGVRQEYFLQPIRDIHLHSARLNEPEPPGNAAEVIIFSAIALLILLIACLNFISLTTARSATRAKEVSIRKVLGACRSKLIKQFILESFILIIISVSIAIVIVELSLHYINNLLVNELSLDLISNAESIGLIAGFFLILGLLAGGYPAFYLTSKHPLQVFRGNLKEGNQGAIIRKTMVIFQFAVSVILIVGTFIIFQQLRFLKKSDYGFDKEQLLVLSIPVGSLFGKNYEEFISNEFTKHHSISSATTTSFIPGMTKHLFKGKLQLIGGTDPQSCDMNIMMVDHDFIDTYQIGLAAGRFFDKNKSSDAGNGCLINDTAVKAFGWESAEKAIGKRIKDFQEREIIGVTKNFHFQSMQHIIEPLVLMINPDFYVYMTLKIDKQNLSESLTFVEKKWHQLFANEPFVYHFFDDIFELQYLADEKFAKIVLIFAVLAIFIACLGLFGLSLFTTQQRTKEIGIRKVLGSSIPKIIFLLTKETMKWVIVANIVAFPIAGFILYKWLQNFAYQIDIGWETFILAGFLTLAIALITVSYQTIRVASINPVESLRYE